MSTSVLYRAIGMSGYEHRGAWDENGTFKFRARVSLKKCSCLPVPNPLRNDSRDPIAEVVTEQGFAEVRVLHGGSEVTNSPRTFLNGVNSRRDCSVASTRKEKSQRLWCSAPHNVSTNGATGTHREINRSVPRSPLSGAGGPNSRPYS